MATDARTSSKKFTKEEKSWILYDWANSVYATNIMAVLFPIYFGNVCAAAGADNLVLWSYGTSVATKNTLCSLENAAAFKHSSTRLWNF